MSMPITSFSNVPTYAAPPAIAADAPMYAPIGTFSTSRPSATRMPRNVSSHPEMYATPSTTAGVACT